MNGIGMVHRYARALYETALSLDSVKIVKKDIYVIDKLCSEKEVHEFLLKQSKSFKILSEFFKTAFFPYLKSNLTINFLKIVIENKREDILITLKEAFTNVELKQNGIIRVTAEFCRIPDKNILTLIEKNMEKRLGGRIKLETKLNEKLMGGFRISWNYMQIDNSLAAKVRKLKETMLFGN